MDYLAWAQCDSGGGRGGWRYGPNYGDSDNSVSQWPVLGLMAAELWGINAPAFVKSELTYWTTKDQVLSGDPTTNPFYGAFDYQPGYGLFTIAETSAGIMELTYCGYDKTYPNITAAEGYINRDWLTNSGWRCNLGNFYGMYAVMKACRLATPTPIKFIANYDGSNGVEWYNGTNEYTDLLLAHQGSDGHWDQWVAPEGVPTDLSTAWAELILEFVPVRVTYTLTVTVLDAVTAGPIAGADVLADGPETHSGTTGTDGKIMFDGIQAGSYQVSASATVHLPSTPQTVLVTSTTDFTIRLHPLNPVPEVPLGTIVALASMLIALVGYFTIPKFRRGQKNLNL